MHLRRRRKRSANGINSSIRLTRTQPPAKRYRKGTGPKMSRGSKRRRKCLWRPLLWSFNDNLPVEEEEERRRRIIAGEFCAAAAARATAKLKHVTLTLTWRHFSFFLAGQISLFGWCTRCRLLFSRQKNQIILRSVSATNWNSLQLKSFLNHSNLTEFIPKVDLLIYSFCTPLTDFTILSALLVGDFRPFADWTLGRIESESKDCR